jgi:hypothetical protein
MRNTKMKRTQIYIDEGTYKILEKESKISGKTISELIRESIRSRVQKKADEILKRLEDVYGIWKDKEINVEGYVRNLRKERTFDDSN